ncbi:MAG: AAA family ATPase [Pseudomonadota bacterium]|nr:AAA family ATPase [Pseudomonadota bacterium]
MRLRRLEFERYGPFTGQSLSFRPDAKLHVVFGENEAGKSCALAAITDLFFGIERQTRYDFLHEGRELRIAAEIEARDGSQLQFRRRKGNKNTLLSAGDAPLGDNALAPFLGGVTREVFCRAFGLGTEALRKGADDMLKSDGDVGATLLAAASGLRGVKELRRSLESEAEQIFDDRRAQHRRFYQALDRYEAARSAISKLTLKSTDWKGLNARINELQERLNGLRSQQDEKASEQAKISRLKRLAPQVALIDGDLRALAELGELPATPDGFAARLRASLDAVSHQRDALARAKADEEVVRQDHDSIEVDAAVLAASAEAQRLFAETGAYAADRRDMPRIQGEAEDFQASIEALAVRLGLSEADGIEAQQPTDAAKALLNSLIADGRSIGGDLAGKQEQLRVEQRGLDELKRQHAARGALTDPKPLRDRLSALAPVLSQIEKRSDAGLAIRKEEGRLADLASRLLPPVGDFEKVARAALPTSDSVARFRAATDATDGEISRAKERVAAADEAARAAEARLHPLSLSGPVPSPEAIAAVRAERDVHWDSLRAALSDAAGALTGPGLTAAISNFERLKSDADRIADQAADDAKRISDHATETRILREERRKGEEGRERLAALAAASADALAGWADLWAGAAIIPLKPAEMQLWLSGVAGLIERRDAVQSSRQDLAALDARIRSVEPALRRLAAELGLIAPETLEVGLVAGQVQARLDELSAAWDEARDLDTRLRDTQARAERLASDASEAARGETAWQSHWRPALLGAGLGPDLTLDQAESVLAAWDEAPTMLRERANRRKRVAGMQRNVEGFEDEARQLIAQVARDLAGMPADFAVKALNERLSAASQAAARRAEAGKRLSEGRLRSAAAERALAEAETALARLKADLPGHADLHGSDLDQTCARLLSRDELRAAVSDKRTQFATQAEGLDEATVRGDLAAFDPDQAEAALRRLAEDQRALTDEANEVYADHRDANNRREALEQGIGAEVAAQQRRGAEAELALAAREWVVLRLAALLLGETMERHRAGQQDPLMQRAGDLFSTVTCGRYASLVQDYDDDDAPRLAGLRPSGERVPVPGLSEGTRDQLYLALRLAYLEDYARRSEPAPFIGDDLFATFDDRRTAAGLRTLAAIGADVQPILFTHHRHVAEAASALGAEVEVLELG